MAKFFFDIDDGEHSVHDVEGVDVESFQTVRNEAIGILPDMARDELPDGDHRVFAVQVRDGMDRVVFRATLTLDAQWVIPPTPQNG